MDLLTYISDMERRKALAAKCGTSAEYLWQIANGWRDRKAGTDLVKRIVEATGGEVTREELRPDIFGEPTPKSSEAA